MHGEAGRDWLSGIPARARTLEERWSLKVSQPFANLTYNYVAPAVLGDGRCVVLKMGFPGSGDLLREAEVLRAFGGRGMVRLIEAAPDALLMERILPGDYLISAPDDDEATRILAKMMLRLRTAAPKEHEFPHLSDWFGGFDRFRRNFGSGTGPLPERMLREAEAVASDLLDSTEERFLLHGDLHHDNVLHAGDDYLAVDPKGVVGDAAYEAAAMMYNPPGVASRPDLRRVFERRLDIICEVTGFERERVLAWAQAQAVLSAVWSVEDFGSGWQEAVTVARTLGEMR